MRVPMAMFASGRSIAGAPASGDLVHVEARHDLHQAERALLARRERVEARLHGDHGEDQHRIEPVPAAFAKRRAHDVGRGAVRHVVAARDDARRGDRCATRRSDAPMVAVREMCTGCGLAAVPRASATAGACGILAGDAAAARIAAVMKPARVR